MAKYPTFPEHLPKPWTAPEGEPSSPAHPAYLTEGWRAHKGPHPDNHSGFSATGHRILLKCDAVEEKSEGGILLVSKTRDQERTRNVWATVIEIGLDCWCDKRADFCQVGDKVLIGEYTGKFHTSPVDEQEYRFVMDLDIISPLRKQLT